MAEALRRDDIAVAQGIFNAMELTCPTGRVAHGRGRDRVKGGIYDGRGAFYDLPAWVVTDPADVVDDDDLDEDDDVEQEQEKDIDSEHMSTTTAARKKRDEKGKARADDLGSPVRIRCRLSDRGSDVVVEVGSKERVEVVIRKIQEQIGSRRIRLMYLGKPWVATRSLEDTGWKEGDVVNALVYEGDEGALFASKGGKR